MVNSELLGAPTDYADGGRRIYVQEQCLLEDALSSKRRAEQMVRCAASLTIPRSYAHAVSEIEMFQGESVELPADRLIGSLGYRAIQSEYFRGMSIVQDRSSDPVQVLDTDESIVANCYFSNYYTLATGDVAAKTMFADNSSIQGMKEANPDGLTLIRPKMIHGRIRRNGAHEWVHDFSTGQEMDKVAQEAIDMIVSENHSHHHDELVASVTQSTARLAARLDSLLGNIHTP
jgi:hypothetical protein